MIFIDMVFRKLISWVLIQKNMPQLYIDVKNNMYDVVVTNVCLVTRISSEFIVTIELC